MSYELPGNPYTDYEPQTDFARTVNAIGALTYEQRTANLLAYYGILSQKNHRVPPELQHQVMERLGLDEDPS